jgi:predicted phage tail component-like protein
MITLDIAYDEVTEETLRRMRKVFESDTIHPLIFDDAPYKVYYAKVQSQPILKYIPF